MKLFKKTLKVNSKGEKPTYINITGEVKDAIKESEINEGILHVISPHTTCAVFFEEFVHDIDDRGDEYLQLDLNDVLERIIPKNTRIGQYNYPGEKHYEAVESWPNASSYLPNGDRSALLNCDAHLKASLLGSSETFEITKNTLGVGSTGYVYFVDFDTTRKRERNVKLVLIGE
ncbi:MAG: YjbQ family protein [Tissierellia bacterium]|nr:YjbQ family protein [Tissierellia bacterium]